MPDLLVELGTEELPPKSLAALGEAFADGLRDALVEAGLLATDAPPAAAWWSPRRLAARADGVLLKQPDRRETRKGPAVKAAYDADGKPTKAAQGFAKANGLAVGDLKTLTTDDGAWVMCERQIVGRRAEDVIPGLVEAALAGLPIARRMRWGSSDAQFVRPVHWLVMLLDDRVVPGTVLGLAAGRETRGHRFHAPEPITLTDAHDYPARLEAEGQVRANARDGRLALAIREMVRQASLRAGGTPRFDDALVAEVAALVEWPVPVTGSFDRRFLELPREVIESVLELHQRYFPVYDADGSLLPHFIALANVDSHDHETVKKGNERVILPRLTDAQFFYGQDRQRRLDSRVGELDAVAFQAKLGSLGDKAARVAALAERIAPGCGADPALAARAARLAKCDLLTLMVAEFPDLQGTMGRYYALQDGEDDAVAAAIGEQYLPRYAGDRVPASPAGRALSLADRLDTLAGVFATGARPSGDKDPYALRRAAHGVLRILVEGDLPLDLAEIVAHAADGLPGGLRSDGLAGEVTDFVMERMPALLTDETPPGVFDAVFAVRPTRPADFVARVRAVTDFRQLPEADALVAANKRIANLLKQADGAATAVDDSLLAEPAEQALWNALQARTEVVRTLLDAGDYSAALRELAALREPVDAFFDAVMVMTDDPAQRANRIALLAALLALFREVADVGRL